MRSNRSSVWNANHKMRFQVARAKEKSKIERRVHGVAVLDNAERKDSRLVYSRMLKRASPYSSTVLEAYAGTTQKVKAVDKQGKKERVDPANFQTKVDAAADPDAHMIPFTPD